jgi:LuxR family transcriptional regulator, quorum-sensing system regulator BjaR1
MGQSLDYSKVAFDLIDDLDGLTTVGKVVTRLGTTLAEFGYTSFLITGVPEPPQKLEPYILLNGWPRGWTEHYTRSNYYADDPVAAWCRRTVNPFEWSQAPFNAERSPRAAEVMNVAREFGLDHGFLVPIVASMGFQACVTMAGERPNCEPRAKRALHLIGMYAHARCAALIGCESDGQRRRILSERERDVLAWSAEGKSSWEIATILGLSERTVNWHVEQAERKLDAVTRTQAVIKAPRSGEI